MSRDIWKDGCCTSSIHTIIIWTLPIIEQAVAYGNFFFYLRWALVGILVQWLHGAACLSSHQGGYPCPPPVSVYYLLLVQTQMCNRDVWHQFLWTPRKLSRWVGEAYAILPGFALICCEVKHNCTNLPIQNHTHHWHESDIIIEFWNGPLEQFHQRSIWPF